MNVAEILRKAEVLKADVADGRMGPAEAWTSRQTLQDLYQQALVTDLEYALDKKVEQDLWNHAFKNQITAMQMQTKDKTNPNRRDIQASLAVFLEGASGFYLQLLQELCSAFDLDLPFRPKSSNYGIMGEPRPWHKILPPQPSSCLYICQHCLVHLGDIARYRNQLSQAESFYRHAAQLVPYNGQPYNQMAILAASRAEQLPMVFYYCRSIAVKHPFPAAATNLNKTFSKLADGENELKTHKLSSHEVVLYFLRFHAHIYLSKDLPFAAKIKDLLISQFRTHLYQEAFTLRELVYMVAINLFSLHHVRDCTTDKDIDTAAYSDEEVAGWNLALGMSMSLLSLMLHYIPTKSEQSAQDSPCLAAVKVTLDWLTHRPNLFEEETIMDKPFIWPKLARVLNCIQLKERINNPANRPLPEDFELQGFLPLVKAHRPLDFSKGQSSILEAGEVQVQYRCQRLCDIGTWITDNRPSLMKKQDKQGAQKFKFTSPLKEEVREDKARGKSEEDGEEEELTPSWPGEGEGGVEEILSEEGLKSVGIQAIITRDNRSPEVSQGEGQQQIPLHQPQMTPQSVPLHHPFQVQHQEHLQQLQLLQQQQRLQQQLQQQQQSLPSPPVATVPPRSAQDSSQYPMLPTGSISLEMLALPPFVGLQQQLIKSAGTFPGVPGQLPELPHQFSLPINTSGMEQSDLKGPNADSLPMPGFPGTRKINQGQVPKGSDHQYVSPFSGPAGTTAGLQGLLSEGLETYSPAVSTSWPEPGRTRGIPAEGLSRAVGSPVPASGGQAHHSPLYKEDGTYPADRAEEGFPGVGMPAFNTAPGANLKLQQQGRELRRSPVDTFPSSRIAMAFPALSKGKSTVTSSGSSFDGYSRPEASPGPEQAVFTDYSPGLLPPQSTGSGSYSLFQSSWSTPITSSTGQSLTDRGLYSSSLLSDSFSSASETSFSQAFRDTLHLEGNLGSQYLAQEAEGFPDRYQPDSGHPQDRGSFSNQGRGQYQGSAFPGTESSHLSQLGTNIGLGFSSSGSSWPPPSTSTTDTGNTGYFSSDLQSIWSSTPASSGQSALEQLLQQQKQQRDNTPP
ncbi:protein SMG7-like [Branchiostoma floridae]|uniref:Protein SMG7-like n=1 Tax=Branchiostoma floridae TaxID=7739 RepID=A0A9J7LP95_BRAFL|nr:protein SMG7-like [Branchiostoma floridae]